MSQGVDRLPENWVDLCLEMKDDGQGITHMAKRFKVHPDVLVRRIRRLPQGSRVLLDENRPPRPQYIRGDGRYKLPENWYDIAVWWMSNEGWGMRQVCEHFGVTVKGLEWARKRLPGWKRERLTALIWQNRYPPKLTKGWEYRLLAELDDGKPYHAIREAWGVSATALLTARSRLPEDMQQKIILLAARNRNAEQEKHYRVGHGSQAGYRKHLRHRTVPCDPCTAAHARERARWRK